MLRMIQNLESRRLLSASLDASGLLTVKGSNTNDTTRLPC
jgi:hypothetical protein